MEEAQARRQKLKAIREEAQKQQGTVQQQEFNENNKVQEQEQSKQEQQQIKQLRFRNYQPQNKDLKYDKVQQARPEEFKKPQIQNEPQDDQELLNSLVPQKANWDLKKAIEKKMDRLERRTQKALIEMLLQSQQQATDGLANGSQTVEKVMR